MLATTRAWSSLQHTMLSKATMKGGHLLHPQNALKHLNKGLEAIGASPGFLDSFDMLNRAEIIW